MSAGRGISVRRRGSGDPLVLVHGYLGGAAIWGDLSERLSARFDVVMPELSGYGGSARLPPCESIAGHAEEVLERLSGLGIERFHLMGHSMGGMVAQQMAARAPERVDRLVLYGTGPRGAMPDRFETLAQTRERLASDGLEAVASAIPAAWFVEGEAAPGHAACAALAREASLGAALAGLKAMEGWDGRAGLPAIASPTLVLWGDADRSYPWSQPEALWRGIAGARLAVLPGCGHAAHLEDPELVLAVLSRFLPDPVRRTTRAQPAAQPTN